MRLLDAAHQLECEKEVPKSIKASSDLGISKAVATRWLSADEFYHMKVEVAKLPLMAGDVLASGEGPRHIVVVDLNKNKVNRSATYMPKITVVCGADLVRSAKKNKAVTIDCWISVKAAKALKLKLPKVAAAVGFNPSPDFTPGPPVGSVSLPTNVMRLPRGSSFPDATDFGAPGSELNNPQFHSMLNIEEALSMYLSNLKNGIWKPISGHWTVVPPSLRDATNEAGLIAKDKKLAASFSPIDFVYWQKAQLEAPIKVKYHESTRLIASKFAFVGDKDDPSTWLFRADSLPAIKNAVIGLKACAYINRKAKQLTLQELKRRAGL